MDYRLMHAALRCKVGRSADKSVLIALCSVVTTDPKQAIPDFIEVKPSIKTLETYTELNQRTLNAAIDRLHGLGAFDLIKEHGKSNRYILNCQAITTCKFTGSSKITGTCNFTGTCKSAKQPPVNLHTPPPVNLQNQPPVNLQNKDNTDYLDLKEKREAGRKFTDTENKNSISYFQEKVLAANKAYEASKGGIFEPVMQRLLGQAVTELKQQESCNDNQSTS